MYDALPQELRRYLSECPVSWKASDVRTVLNSVGIDATLDRLKQFTRHEITIGAQNLGMPGVRKNDAILKLH